MLVVTGANGFIGSALVAELNQWGQDSIIAVDIISVTERPELLRKAQYSQFLGHREFLARLSEPEFANKIDFVFHMGASSATTVTDKAYLEDVNVNYSKELFSLCAEHNIPLIYASSASVYGDGSLGFSDEADPERFRPLHLYGWSKQEVDSWALQQRLQPPRWYGLRFYNVFGPNEYFKGYMQSVVIKAYHQILETGQLKLFRSHRRDYQDGHQKRDFIYVKDITRWMVQLMKKTEVESGIYNMGTGVARSWLDLVRSVFESMGQPVSINWIDIPPELRDQYQYFTEARMEKWLRQGMDTHRWNLEAAVKDYISNHLMRDNPYL